MLKNYSSFKMNLLLKLSPRIGSQAGNAIADVLFGDVNPGGKLPITFPNKENETEFSPAQWPGRQFNSI